MREGYMTTGEAIAKELNKTLIRYRAGLISLDQSRQELALLMTLLKAYETTVIEDKLDKIEAVLEGRR
jgi:hypothetical protein